VTTKGAVRPLNPRGVWGHVPPQKNLESKSSEMHFPAFWASKSTLLMGIFIDHKAGLKANSRSVLPFNENNHFESTLL